MVKSLQDEDLKVLGRDHSPQQALLTVAEARRLCPGRVSVDVMFGRPKQSVESWENELSELLRVCDDHVSLYQLTLERGTQLFKQVLEGEVTLPTEEETAEMYLCARKTLHQHGLLQYEVSNFARQVSPQQKDSTLIVLRSLGNITTFINITGKFATLKTQLDTVNEIDSNSKQMTEMVLVKTAL